MTNPIEFTSFDRHLFGHGTHYQVYEKLGAHPVCINGLSGVSFAVWAPHATSVSVIGNFNQWNPKAHPMPMIQPGVYQIFVPEAAVGDLYKYHITTPQGNPLAKADPYAFSAELRPGTASRVSSLDYSWGDSQYLRRRSKNPPSAPLSIYEVHLPSWRKNHEGSGFLNYRQLASSLALYVKNMGYTHVELIGIAEHPLDASWGYQVTGYYAPTSRHGSPQDFMYLVDQLHQAGIGVLLDWVPAHFPRDAHGLSEFDGQPLYEPEDPRNADKPYWGTKSFDYSRPEVSNFLLANALFWLEKFHLDGLRVDAVASMLYLDFGKKNGEWTPNRHGGNQNLDAIEFFRHLGSIVHKQHPHALLIAEESSTWPGVTTPPEQGGLGFTFKWNMGWMRDFLDYLKQDPLFRKYHHNNMTFAMTYAHSEQFILVLSHDEVVHLKRSMLEKLPESGKNSFAALTVAYTFFMGHPGKKLLFMGQEFGQRREWSEERELDWFLLDQPDHRKLQSMVKGLLHLYRRTPCLYERERGWDGFRWINADDRDRSIFSFLRLSENGKKNLLFICHFTPVDRPDYRVGIPWSVPCTLLFDENIGLYQGPRKRPVYHPENSPCDHQEYSFSYPLKGYGCAIFSFDLPDPRENSPSISPHSSSH